LSIAICCKHLLALGLLLVLVLAASVSLAQQQATETVATPASEDGATPLSITESILDAKIKEIDSNPDLSQSDRDKLSELYDKTRSLLETIAANNAKAASYTQALATASAEAGKIRGSLGKRRRALPWEELGLNEDSPLERIEARLLKEKAERTAASARLADIKRVLATESERLNEIQVEINDARSRLAKVGTELTLDPPADQNPVLSQALRWNLQAQGRFLSRKIAMLGQELLSQPARVELLKARRDQLESELEHLEGRVRYLEELAGQRRKVQAERARRAAVKAQVNTRDKHPLLGRVAKQNTLLSQQLAAVSAQLDGLSLEDDKLDAEAEGLEGEFRTASRKLDLLGLGEALGQVLQAKQRELPDAAELEKQQGLRQRLTTEISLRLIQHNQEYRSLRHIQDRIDQLTEDMDGDDVADIDEELETLLTSKRDLLERFLSTDNAFLRTLSELELAQLRLGEAVHKLRSFLSKRLLWLRSSPAVGLDSAGSMLREAQRLWRAPDVANVGRALYQRATESWLLLPGLLLILVLKVRCSAINAALRATAERLHKPSSDSFVFTVKALALTVLMATPGPLLVALLGWELGQSEPLERLPRVLSLSLLWVAPVYFHLNLLRIICKPGGLALEHFRWPRSGVDRLRRKLTVLMWSFLPVALLITAIIGMDLDSSGGELGRLGMVVLMALIALFFYAVFRPDKGSVQPFIDWAPRSGLARFRWLFLSLGVLLPASLLVLALFGYVYTAITLSAHLLDTIWLLVVLLVVQQLAVRWLLVLRRRIALRLALERRAARQVAAAAEDADEPTPLLDDDITDVATLSDDSRRLVNLLLFTLAMLGLWFIWRDVMPALGIFSDIHLWNRSTLVNGVETIEPVTLTSLLLVLTVLVGAVLLVRRQLAFVQLLMIEVFDLSPSGRYTVATLVRYAIVIVAAMLVFSLLGVDWSKLQWLVAALGVGIGFGLQEIVANFISGLIILFERPIRVGDVVTVGDVDGVVTRIRIRATTIRDWDNKELLVPNKEFITTRLLNWSLSDPTTRLLVRVGIAYGSDVMRASDLLLEAATEDDTVLEDPAPSVIFEAFGDNTLNMVLRCYIPNPDQRTRTISSINHAVNDKFNAAGISIAFPQRDVHLDIGQPLRVSISREGT